MPPTLGLLDYLMLHTSDVQATTAFYRDVLDAAVIEEAYPHWARIRLANIDVGLHLAAPTNAATDASAEPAFRVASIAAFRAHLEAQQGAHHVEISEDYQPIPGGLRLTFRDPAGNRITVTQYGIDLDTLRATTAPAHVT